jgi:hypothetical protein
MKKIPQQIVGNVGQCIYCGKKDTKLSNEHIIPLGLNGFLLLKRASCAACASITSDFEREVLRKSLLESRIGLDLPTRNKTKRPKNIKLTVQKNGAERIIQLDPKENFSAMSFIEYLPPAYLEGRKVEKGISVYASRIVQVSGPSIEDLKKKYDFDSLSISTVWGANYFPRLLAKIAYGCAVAEFGLENIEKNYVLPYIMGEKFDGISEWVGTAKDKIITEKGFHTVRGGVNEKMDIIIRIKLFDLWDVPEYLVVVGKINKNAPKLQENQDPKKITPPL